LIFLNAVRGPRIAWPFPVGRVIAVLVGRAGACRSAIKVSGSPVWWSMALWCSSIVVLAASGVVATEGPAAACLDCG